MRRVFSEMLVVFIIKEKKKITANFQCTEPFNA